VTCRPAVAHDLESPWRRRSSFEPRLPDPTPLDLDAADLPVSQV
jgi:hypothetical protein